ncbi:MULTISPECIES: ParB/RepB/Spo0J family partition protein [Sphingomonadaceae]|jgi:ParB family chromosome partitioning protein|uniref:ParB/RepB/Spo0J family partition protein n=3 Tax=Parasphingorhabdus TaxID=2709685 RepID=A0ABX2N4Y1_9SPHN|nr:MULTISPECIES: ParB/RepB/Spo0J family partition protein [Sphingomonadaceae]NRD88289.1 chromosome partitioning protein ParB [Sphingopyxis sp. BSNA05]NVD28739.1 ParB/RepB/Spo0J family partition protein [Parasphingorhabdus flavimaris]PHR18443.1 MAG: chromosome partitioning protein ParB [Sphingopyxis sp.]|tara:strand:+ start:6678 stop:8657 length:1980 start_codon:yes stop_codon:yes gene_type:complete
MFKSIPLNKLVESKKNVRKRTDPAADAWLKADIAARGLLQNLVVNAIARGKFEVTAGGRRLNQLKALAKDKAIKKTEPITCLVKNGEAHEIREISLAENFQRVKLNPADEAEAFQDIVNDGASVEDVAIRFGQTVRFVEGRLRLAKLAPVVFEALASGDITLDIAKAYGATSDVERQAQVFEEVSGGYYSVNSDSIRRMVLDASVQASDPRAVLVGRDAYLEAGGKIDRELFDDDETESWVDVALLERLAAEKMEWRSDEIKDQHGLAWVKPTLDCYVSHELVEGLNRLPTELEPLSEEAIARLSELEIEYDGEAVILENEDSSEDDVFAAEKRVSEIEQEMRSLDDRKPVLADALRSEAGAFLALGNDGIPTLVPQYYTDKVDVEHEDEGVELVEEGEAAQPKRTALSKRLVDELAMQRRDILSLHVASDPALALDFMIFTLADSDSHDWRAQEASTLKGPVANGPAHNFEAKDAPASASLAELRGSLDESWKASTTDVERFVAFRELSDDARSAWLGHVVSRTLIASLNVEGDRQVSMHDYLGGILEIDMAAWWRPTAANYFDRVPKAKTLDGMHEVGGLELSNRYGASKKSDLAATAERIFSGNFIAEAEVKQQAARWVPDAMRFADLSAADEVLEDEASEAGASEDIPEIADKAA